MRVNRRFMASNLSNPTRDGKLVQLAGMIKDPGEDATPEQLAEADKVNGKLMSEVKLAEDRLLQAVRYALELPEYAEDERGAVSGATDEQVLEVWMALGDFNEDLKKNGSPTQTPQNSTGRRDSHPSPRRNATSAGTASGSTGTGPQHAVQPQSSSPWVPSSTILAPAGSPL